MEVLEHPQLFRITAKPSSGAITCFLSLFLLQ